jgi:hypothetical protein
MRAAGTYLFASRADAPDETPSGVFYWVEDESLATSLCRLCTQEFTDANGHPSFHHKPATSFSSVDQVLMDESLESLALYDDPDAGVYDPEPTHYTLFRAQYVITAQRWEELLRKGGDSGTRPRKSGLGETAPGRHPDVILPASLTLFYSYSHKDEKHRNKLETHLSSLKRQGLISEWHDRKISGGTDWKGRIDEHLETAQVILLLVSADFIHSDYCFDVELKRAIERHDAGEARVIPIIVRPCDWHSAPFGKLQAFPKDGKPITKWKPQDDAYLDIARQLRQVIDELRTPARNPSAEDRSAPRAPSDSPGAKTQQFDEVLKVSLNSYGAGATRPPYGSGEPFHLSIDLTLVNLGTSPVFIVCAQLKDAEGKHLLSFSDVCNENEALQPGARRKGRLNLLYHTPFPRGPRHPRTQDALRQENVFVFRLLRFICQKGSVFHVETGRGTTLTYPATEVSDANFLGWPYIATPQDILNELGSKSLEDFEREFLAAFEQRTTEAISTSQTPLSAEVQSFYYQDVTADAQGPPVITPYPRRYLTELALTNHSDRPVYVKRIAIKIGSRTYGRAPGADVIRLESGEYRELDESFPVEDNVAAESGEFALEITPAVGDSMTFRGSFPVHRPDT